MSSGYDLFCKNCDFGFSTGWNHHAAATNCVCTSCATVFSIKGFRSIWGVEDGEVCHLYQSNNPRRKPRKKHRGRPTEIDTGVKVVAMTSNWEYTELTGETATFEVCTFRLEGIECPVCHQEGKLRLSLETGELCPKCRVGSIENGGMLEY